MVFRTLSPINVLATTAMLLSGCATETHRSITPQPLASAAAATHYSGPKSEIVVGKVQNSSTYHRGIFSDGVDRLGQQAKGILLTRLQQTGRFAVLDRDNMQALKSETEIRGGQQKLEGAHYLIVGEIAGFGRKKQGDNELFGILGRGKKQIAYCKFDLRVVDTRTSATVYSTEGEGEYAVSDRQVLGFGGTSGYDATLNGKVLDLSVRNAVNQLVEAMQNGSWRP